MSRNRSAAGPSQGARTRALLLALLTAATAVAQAQPAAPAAQPRPVEPAFFGLTVNRSDAARDWPSIPFGSWRIWDSQVSWPYLEPKPGQWDFSKLDRMVAEAADHRVEPLLVLGHSPAWASARPTEKSSYGAGFAAEPRRWEDWDNYVRTVATRYKGRIPAYQVWNEPSDRGHFSGTVEQMVELACRARRIVREVDPSARIVSPGYVGLGRHLAAFREFAVKGGRNCIDVVAYHLYVPRYGPEAMVDVVRKVRATMSEVGIAHLPLWATEVGWWIENTDGQPEHPIVAKGGWRKIGAGEPLAAAITRALVLAAGEGVERVYWYMWNNNYGWSLADQAGRPKPGVDAWSDTEKMLLGRRVQRCELRSSAASCEVVDPAGGVARLQWTIGDALERVEGASRSPAAVGSRPEPMRR